MTGLPGITGATGVVLMDGTTGAAGVLDTGQTVVETAITDVMILLLRNGQLVTVGAQLEIV